MSVPAKLTLCAATITSIGIVSYVCIKQRSDRDRLHEGVIRDVERQQMRKLENLYTLQQQVDLTRQLKKELESST
ncbi:hypothetical protein HA402_010508 [Bradysia odoriphaga]|nr:hypothetical protein HA402_010508 [Bradysia odoriphaga]